MGRNILKFTRCVQLDLNFVSALCVLLAELLLRKVSYFVSTLCVLLTELLFRAVSKAPWLGGGSTNLSATRQLAINVVNMSVIVEPTTGTTNDKKKANRRSRTDGLIRVCKFIDSWGGPAPKNHESLRAVYRFDSTCRVAIIMNCTFSIYNTNGRPTYHGTHNVSVYINLL